MRPRFGAGRRGTPRLYSWVDYLRLRLASRLDAQDVPARRIRHAIDFLDEHFDEWWLLTDPLSADSRRHVLAEVVPGATPLLADAAGQHAMILDWPGTSATCGRRDTRHALADIASDGSLGEAPATSGTAVFMSPQVNLAQPSVCGTGARDSLRVPDGAGHGRRRCRRDIRPGSASGRARHRVRGGPRIARILLDEHLPPRLAHVFTALGHAPGHLIEEGLRGADRTATTSANSQGTGATTTWLHWTQYRQPEVWSEAYTAHRRRHGTAAPYHSDRAAWLASAAQPGRAAEQTSRRRATTNGVGWLADDRIALPSISDVGAIAARGATRSTPPSHGTEVAELLQQQLGYGGGPRAQYRAQPRRGRS